MCLALGDGCRYCDRVLHSRLLLRGNRLHVVSAVAILISSWARARVPKPREWSRSLILLENLSIEGVRPVHSKGTIEYLQPWPNKFSNKAQTMWGRLLRQPRPLFATLLGGGELHVEKSPTYHRCQLSMASACARACGAEANMHGFVTTHMICV